MSWRTVVISKRCKLDLKMGYVVTRGEETKRIFLDEIAILVIENPDFFREFLRDISTQLDGFSGKAVLSRDDTPIGFLGNVELIDSFVSFEISRKTLLTKLVSQLESIAVSESNYLHTASLMGELEQYIQELSFELPCDILCSKMSIGSVLRAVGIEISDDYANDLERLLDYMELTRELERDRLFLLVNLRSWYSDEEVSKFLSSILSHEYHVLLVDSISKVRLPNEERVTIDTDLCEF